MAVAPLHFVIVCLNTFMAWDIFLGSAHSPRNKWWLKKCLSLNTRGWYFHQPSAILPPREWWIVVTAMCPCPS
jgi:hypothetical protein